MIQENEEDIYERTYRNHRCTLKLECRPSTVHFFHDRRNKSPQCKLDEERFISSGQCAVMELYMMIVKECFRVDNLKNYISIR